MMQQFRASSYLFGGNAPFVEQLYEQWLEDAQSVPVQWRDYFERLQLLPAPAGGAAPRTSQSSAASMPSSTPTRWKYFDAVKRSARSRLAWLRS